MSETKYGGHDHTMIEDHDWDTSDVRRDYK